MPKEKKMLVGGRKDSTTQEQNISFPLNSLKKNLPLLNFVWIRLCTQTLLWGKVCRGIGRHYTANHHYVQL